jgi:hypothetical protein
VIRKWSTRLDRYPAKMVAHLAEKLVLTASHECTSIYDPFCGSGAILLAAQKHGIRCIGTDINPYGMLLSNVKLRGFNAAAAQELCADLIDTARSIRKPFRLNWSARQYWFTEGTLDKYEQLRAAAVQLNLARTRNGQAVLLALALSVRLCSKCDQRSPKPFISRRAIQARKGRHFDPFKEIPLVLGQMGKFYGRMRRLPKAQVVHHDLLATPRLVDIVGQHSHVITSPPYINAQDYFRNFKLELYVLEGILPFSVSDLTARFIGTERGLAQRKVPIDAIERYHAISPEVMALASQKPCLAKVVYQYFYDMETVFDGLANCLKDGGSCTLVCGDNLIGGIHIRTWAVLDALVINRGFRLANRFADQIVERLLPPARTGHKGLIKEETVSSYKYSRSD